MVFTAIGKYHYCTFQKQHIAFTTFFSETITRGTVWVMTKDSELT